MNEKETIGGNVTMQGVEVLKVVRIHERAGWVDGDVTER